MTDNETLPRRWLLALCLAQGMALYALSEASDTGGWLETLPVVAFPLWALAVAAPMFILLSVDRGNVHRVLRDTAICCAVLAGAAAYLGFQATPAGEFPVNTLVLTATVTLALACFKALMYLQQRAASAPMTYDVLFRNSWRNFLTVALAGAFVAGVSLVLSLWASIFVLIGIGLFREAFAQGAFWIPAMTISFGAGVLIFRSLTPVIDSITRLLEGLMRMLLPLVVALTLTFLAGLTFAGLNALWAVGSGTSVVLWLAAAVLFLLNAVYQTGASAPPYPRALHAAIAVGVLALPILCVLTGYGIWLRVEQYGWTVQRCFAVLICALLTLFAFGYAWGVVRRRLDWPRTLAVVNTNMGLVVLAAMVAVNSPALDFRKISLASQVARVQSGEIEWRAFDFHYARYQLARPGYLQSQALLAETGDRDPELARLIREPISLAHARAIQQRDGLWEELTYRPPDMRLPPALRRTIETSYVVRPGGAVTAVQVDLNDDGQPEYALLVTNGDHTYGSFYFLDADRWQTGSLQPSTGRPESGAGARIRTDAVSTAPPRFNDLVIGDQVFRTR